MTRRQRERAALIAFLVLWCGGWPIGYPFTGDPHFLWFGPAVLAFAVVVGGVAKCVSDWIDRGTQ